LEDIGISPDGTEFLVAWPYDGIVNQCFRIPLGEDNKWAPMLADSDDCATFAYISNDCLEERRRQRRLREKDLPAVKAEIVSAISQNWAHRLEVGGDNLA
jgi:hypothetical protein